MIAAMLVSCSKEEFRTEEQYAKANAGVDQIVFMSNAIADGIFVTGCLPSGQYLLKNGRFSGNLTGYGKLNPSLSPYSIISCEVLPIDPPNSGEPWMYHISANGTLAMNTLDQCSVRFSGNIYPWYYTNYGFYGGNFIGSATITSGAGRFQSLVNKVFEVYNGSTSGPAVNLETGNISLRFNVKK